MFQNLQDAHLLNYVLIVGFSVLISLFAIPSILHVAAKRHLYDDLGHFRKQHDHGIPRLGGVAIFLSFTITSLLCCSTDNPLPINYLLTACIILFGMGLKDDLSGVNPSTKFIIQFFVCAILVIPGDIRLTSMYGVFGIYELPYAFSIGLSVVTIMMIINAFNLVDGIDGLAAITGIIANVAFAILFYYIDQYELAAISLAIVGAMIGFLRFNLTPAKIFMGDTGSLLVGLISAVMAVKFIEVNKFVEGAKSPEIFSAPALSVAILIIPIFDTLRVFFIRLASGSSPFKADRNHLHHRILTLGFNHLQTTLLLGGINILAVILALEFSAYGNTVLLLLIGTLLIMFNWVITFCIRSKERETFALRNLFV
ncbi:MAG: undecaprenyl/decaprenyl-phosphate alpha-N-acetylglucosaminyl 1-phosphate transferase [Sphingobacteriaceae bacterium]|nr:MAG: undecaprenyl/decaprenyl-phosphate alpha-N-acetylglucosaminyl 1-phosphate transferase [Sphingobacteriaceae bacterium]